jgi:uncharacterized protein YndB with AHSA1/START domain
MVSNSMRTVENSIEIQCSPQRVLEAFINDKDLQNWWQASKSFVQPQPGGLYALVWQLGAPDIKYVTTGLVRFYIQGRELLVNNMVYINHDRKSILGPMEMYVTAVRTGENACVINLLQSGFQQGADWDWYYNAVSQGWPYALGLLKTYLEGRKEVAQ